MKFRYVKITSHYLLLLLLTLGWVGCEVKDPTPAKTAPTGLVTSTVSGITGSEATILCNVAGNGGEELISKGVIYSSTNSTPSETDGYEVNATSTDVGTYSVFLTGLSGNTKYYVRAFAHNSVGYAYGSVKEFTTLNGGSSGGTVTDIDGNVYSTVTIGTQTWMKSNLKVKRYRNGGTISTNLSNTQWQNTSSPACAIYDDNSSNDDTYGKLYNWYTVNSGDLCPAGWHVPSDNEWTTLGDFLGGAGNAGGKMKATVSLWASPNSSATNSSGFTALPGGIRDSSDGFFKEKGSYGNWWSATSFGSSDAIMRYIGNSSGTLGADSYPKKHGFSVRCIKD